MNHRMYSTSGGICDEYRVGACFDLSHDYTKFKYEYNYPDLINLMNNPQLPEIIKGNALVELKLRIDNYVKS
jgi:hypothetical protein